MRNGVFHFSFLVLKHILNHSAIAQWYLPAGTCLPKGRGREQLTAFIYRNMNDIYYVYVIKSEIDGRLYVGMSRDVAKRFDEHNKGYVFSTKGYRPWKLVFREKVGGRVEARRREKYLKGGSGKEYIKKMINNLN